MNLTSAVSRRSILAGSAGLIVSPAIVGRATAVTRGVTDTEIVIGTMTDLSGVARAGRKQCECDAYGLRRGEVARAS